MSKNIVLFIDGTWNEPHSEDQQDADTNVRKLYDVAVASESQVTLYLSGVGTDHPADPDDPAAFEKAEYFLKKLAGGLAGFGVSHRIKKAYQFLSRHYENGDRIFLFGFSRGAFAVRSLANFANTVGLLLRQAAKEQYTDAAYYMYERSRDKGNSLVRAFLRDLVNEDQTKAEITELPIHFIGVWDTVAAHGLPDRLKFLTARYTEHHQTELPQNITHARQALALHELRENYAPLLWTICSRPGQSLLQKWFVGAHSDVGGGYRKPLWSEIALEWMAKEAVDRGLELKSSVGGGVSDHERSINQADKGLNALLSKSVRDALSLRLSLSDVTMDSFGIHQSVFDRLQKFNAAKYGFPPPASDLLIDVDDASLQLAFEVRLRWLEAHGFDGRGTFDWYKDVRATDLRMAAERVDEFLQKARRGFTDEEKSDFIRSLSALFVVDDVSRLRETSDRVRDTNSMRGNFNDSEVSNWLLGATVVTQTAVTCIPLLREDSQSEVRKLFDQAKNETDGIVMDRERALLRQQIKSKFNPKL